MRFLPAAMMLVAALTSPAHAQHAPDSGAVLVRAGRLFDSERGRFLPARDILIRGDTIAAVGERLTAPPGARVVDLTRYTVLPGLIDAHTHLLYLENLSAGGLASEGLRAVAMEGTPLRALRGAARGRTFLEAGITTVRDLGNSGRFGDVALRTAVDEGSADGPRMYVSGPGLAPEGGQFPGLTWEHRDLAAGDYRIVRGAEDARQAVRENATFGATVIKVYANATPNVGRLTAAELEAIVAEARLLGLKVTAHATDDAAIRAAVLAGVDAIEHGYRVSDSTLALMAKRGVALVPTDGDSVVTTRMVERMRVTPAPTPAQLSEYLERGRDRLRRAVKAGVPIVAGSDMYLDLGMPQGAAARRVLFAYRQAGLTPVQILQAATVNAARLIGEPRLGAIRPGAFADLVAVEGDPAADFGALEQVRFVMKSGKEYISCFPSKRE